MNITIFDINTLGNGVSYHYIQYISTGYGDIECLSFGLGDGMISGGRRGSLLSAFNKISRGGFTAVFFVQCLVAAGVTDVRLI